MTLKRALAVMALAVAAGLPVAADWPVTEKPDLDAVYRIKEEGPQPDILRFLPDGSYDPSTLRYFFRNEILIIHYYVADAKLFQLHEKTDAVLVRMTLDKSYLLLIQYPTSDEADSACIDFSRHYMAESGGKGMVQTENKKWTGCIKHKSFLVVVFDGGSQTQAQDLLELVRRRLP